MKKITQKLWLLCLSIVFVFTTKAQNTCSTSVTYTYPVTQTVSSYTPSNYWFTVTTPGAGNYQLNFAFDTTTARTRNFYNYAVYTGSCGSLTMLRTDTTLDSSIVRQTNFYIPLTNTTSTTYYISLGKLGLFTGSFTITTTRQVSIAGQVNYTIGDNDTLFASPIGASGTQTYTWMPGNLHTAQIISTATASTTYTLTYSDALGTLTDTTTAYAKVPIDPIYNCELTRNSSFENYDNTFSVTSNIAPPAGQNNSLGAVQDPANWYAATEGTPDWFSTHLIQSSGMGVPANILTNNTAAEEGNSYAGLITYYGGYREYVQQKLQCSLVEGQAYNVSFYASWAPKSYYSTSNIGAYLSTTNIHDYTSLLEFSALTSYTPQVVSASVIDDSGPVWKKISGTVIGNGEQYITIGNFADDIHTTVGGTVHPTANENYAYYFIDNVSVTPATPTITATSCHSGSVTLTAYGAPSNSVTTWAGPSSYTATGLSITVPSPSVATTYTCSVHLSTGCTTCPTMTASITIQPATTCTGTAVSTPTTSTTLSSGPYYAASSFTVNTLTTLTIGAEMRMAPGTSITVAGGGTLILSSAWLHACNECSSSSMWQGIIVQNGGTLKIQSSHGNPSYIEDAVNGVYTAVCNTTCSIPTWTITNAVFNKNTIDIYIDSHTGNLSTNVIGGNCVFTCRNLNSHSSSSSTYTALRTDLANSTPLHLSTANPLDLTIAGIRTQYGIYINQTNVANPVKVGVASATTNIFDNMDKGIHAAQSSLTVKNNVFQNLTGNTTNVTGIGIYIDGSAKAAPTLIVGNDNVTIVSGESNQFTNCLMGIYALDIAQIFVNNNTFNNETTATTFSTSGTHVTGRYAVLNKSFGSYASGSNVEQLQFANNNVQNCAAGYNLSFGKLFNTAHNSLYFKGNAISATGLSTAYCTYGLYIAQSTVSVASAGVQTDALNITGNTITNVASNCISLNTINTSTATTGFVQVYNNGELSVQYNAAATTPQSPPIAAISLVNAYRTRVTYNNNLSITNQIYAPSPFPAVQYIAGVYTNASANCTINCNTATYTGEGFVFEGNCATANNNWQKNHMGYSQYGLVLRNTGILGDQGSLSYPIDADWYFNSWFSQAQTLADVSDPSSGVTSILYTQATPTCTYKPCTNTFTPGGTAYLNGTTLKTITSGSNTLTCGAAGTNDRMANPGQTTFGDNDMTSDDSLRYQTIQSTIGNNNYTYPVYDAETRWSLQYMVSSNLPTVTPAVGYENAKTLALADGALSNQNYSDALSLTNSFSPTNIIETNWQAVNNIIIKVQGDATGKDTLTVNDISTLQSVAAQCPHSGGNIVFNARTLLNNYFNIIISYPNDCPVNGDNNRTQNATTINKLSAAKNQLSLYPNPSNGKLYISNFDATQKNVDVEITDITGKLITKQQSNVSNGLVELNLDVNNGVYFVKTIMGNSNTQVQKIIINK